MARSRLFSGLDGAEPNVYGEILLFMEPRASGAWTEWKWRSAIALEAGNPDVAYRHLHSTVTHCEQSAVMPELTAAFRQIGRRTTRPSR